MQVFKGAHTTLKHQVIHGRDNNAAGGATSRNDHAAGEDNRDDVARFSRPIQRQLPVHRHRFVRLTTHGDAKHQITAFDDLCTNAFNLIQTHYRRLLVVLNQASSSQVARRGSDHIGDRNDQIFERARAPFKDIVVEGRDRKEITGTTGRNGYRACQHSSIREVAYTRRAQGNRPGKTHWNCTWSRQGNNEVKGATLDGLSATRIACGLNRCNGNDRRLFIGEEQIFFVRYFQRSRC